MKFRFEWTDQLDELANNSLKEAGTKFQYSDEDLVNATLIFTEVLMSKGYDFHQNLPLDKQCIIAEETGKNIRQTIKLFTGIDLYEVINTIKLKL